jgi:hypothetical protein
MGLPAKSEIEIKFKGKRPDVFENSEALENALKQFYGEDCSVNVFQMEFYGEDSVYFDLYSDRYQNLYWQQDLLVKYLKEKCRDEFLEINTSVWTACDEDIHLVEEEIDDYE